MRAQRTVNGLDINDRQRSADYAQRLSYPNGEFEYRVSGVKEPYERVVRESELSDV